MKDYPDVDPETLRTLLNADLLVDWVTEFMTELDEYLQRPDLTEGSSHEAFLKLRWNADNTLRAIVRLEVDAVLAQPVVLARAAIAGFLAWADRVYVEGSSPESDAQLWAWVAWVRRQSFQAPSAGDERTH